VDAAKKNLHLREKEQIFKQASQVLVRLEQLEEERKRRFEKRT